VAACEDCLRELSDPANRGFKYAFTNCGPCFTIIQDIPDDRGQMTMRNFRMCPACQAEYEDPLDRRFHAQPNACPVCGPQLSLVEKVDPRKPAFTGSPALEETGLPTLVALVVAIPDIRRYMRIRNM